jgi:hypothetical protein
MVPVSCELVSRRYHWPDSYDRGQTHEAAKKFLYRLMVDRSSSKGKGSRE